MIQEFAAKVLKIVGISFDEEVRGIDDEFLGAILVDQEFSFASGF